MSSSGAKSAAAVVTISYRQLVDFDAAASNRCGEEYQNLVDSIGRAFGSSSDCLGLIAVEGIPEFVRLRERLLRMGPQLAQYCSSSTNDDDTDDGVVKPGTLFSVGWSHGREQLAQGKPDLAKGSYYANPLTESLIQSLVDREPEREEYWREQGKLHPECYADNVWPTKLPLFQPAFLELGQVMAKTGILLAAVCDEYCRQQGVELGLQETLGESRNAKGRLLHYFPISNDNNNDDDDHRSWCGWHNDHGSLTALAPGMYLDMANGILVDNPDPEHSGLYIQARSGNMVHVSLPDTVCGFQIGETSQIQSGGILQATPHAVLPPQRQQHNNNNITRESFAVFLEPEFQHPLEIPPGKRVEDCQDADTKLPSSVLPLNKRWKPGYTFGDFHRATISGFTV